MKINKIPYLPQRTYGSIRCISCVITNKVIEPLMIPDHKFGGEKENGTTPDVG